MLPSFLRRLEDHIRAAFLVVLAWGCSQAPDPVTMVAVGDLDGAVAVAASHTIEDPWARWLRRWEALNQEREALRSASRHLVVAAAEEALAEQRLDDAVAALEAVGLRGDGADDPRLTRVAETLQRRAEELAESGEVTQAATIHDGLSWAFVEPRLSRHHRRAAERLARRANIAASYAPSALPATRMTQEGIRVSLVRPALEALDAEYLRPLPLNKMFERATGHVLLVVGDASVQAAYPGVGEPKVVEAIGALQRESAVDSVGALEARLLAIVEVLTERGVPEEVAVYEVVAGALDALDPWTRVVWPAQIAAWSDHHEGVRHGVGLDLRMVDGAILCQAPIFGSPAYAAGVHQGDVVVAIDQVNLATLPVASRMVLAQAALHGEDGTRVVLSIRRGGQERHLTIERSPVEEPVVRGYRRGADNHWNYWIDLQRRIAYVRVTEFRPHTDDRIAAALSDLEARGVVLDLRGNPGGDVDAAVGTADLFLTEGTMATLTGRVPLDLPPAFDEEGNQLPAWNEAVPGHPLEGHEVVVLIDRETASAAEIVAGALQQLGGAPVVGQRSYGKGLSQALRADQERGFALQLTNLEWQLPDGRNLHRHPGAERWGIDPSLVMPLDPAERYLIEGMRRQREHLRVHGDGEPVPSIDLTRRPGMPELSADPQVWAATLVLRARLPSD